MKFENTAVWGFEHALRGMRNAKNSWHLADSGYNDDKSKFVIGPNDMKLSQSLTIGGSEHRKFLRQIFVSVDITAPIYWWKEFDTYKVGTVANSTSTMHKIGANPIVLDCFEIDDYHPDLMIEFDDDGECTHTVGDMADNIIKDMEALRTAFITAEKNSKLTNQFSAEEIAMYSREAKLYWKELIRWLPEGWLQKRTVTMDYENLLAMCSPGQRRFHKLNEWSGKDNAVLTNFIAWARQLPYAQEYLFIDEVIPNANKVKATEFDKIMSKIKTDTTRKDLTPAECTEIVMNMIASALSDLDEDDMK